MAPKKMCAGSVTNIRVAMSAPSSRPTAKYFTFSIAANPSADAEP